MINVEQFCVIIQDAIYAEVGTFYKVLPETKLDDIHRMDSLGWINVAETVAEECTLSATLDDIAQAKTITNLYQNMTSKYYLGGLFI